MAVAASLGLADASDAEAYASVALGFMTGRSVPGSVSHRIIDQTGERYGPFQQSTAAHWHARTRKRNFGSRLVDHGLALLTQQ